MSILGNIRGIRPGRRNMPTGDTLPALFWNAVDSRRDKVWLREKELGIWKSWTWGEVGNAVREIAGGLMDLGLARGECASVLSNTVIEWVLADLAILSCGGVANGIYPTDAPAQVHFLCEDSDTKLLFVENDEQLDKALEIRSRLPQLRKIVVFDMKGLRDFNDEQVISLDALRVLGREFNTRHPNAMGDRLGAIRGEELAILVYTSGTTGKPKGAMQSHRGLIAAIKSYDQVLPQGDQDERMCFLPLCHIAERLAGEYLGIYTGAKLNFVENPQTVPENVREIAPTVFGAVPRVWEKFFSTAMITLKEASKAQQLAYAWSIRIGNLHADRTLAGAPVGNWLKARFAVARWLTLNNVRKLIGIHRVRYCITGAAPVSADLIRWYLALGVSMLEVYGMTESGGPATIMPPSRIRPGTIGTAAPYNEVRIDPDTGEILVRSASVFMGYLNQPEKTAETLDAEGWLHTGDVGSVDAQGYFRITDRLKDIIITAGGKNITPSELESELKFSPYITDAVIVGDRRQYLTAIIMIDQENIENFAQENDIPFSNYTSLTHSREVVALIQEAIDGVNGKFARVEQIKKFYLLETQLSPEDEELTGTMKLKRKLVEKKYAAQIEAMYA